MINPIVRPLERGALCDSIEFVRDSSQVVESILENNFTEAAFFDIMKKAMKSLVRPGESRARINQRDGQLLVTLAQIDSSALTRDIRAAFLALTGKALSATAINTFLKANTRKVFPSKTRIQAAVNVASMTHLGMYFEFLQGIPFKNMIFMDETSFTITSSPPKRSRIPKENVAGPHRAGSAPSAESNSFLGCVQEVAGDLPSSFSVALYLRLLPNCPTPVMHFTMTTGTFNAETLGGDLVMNVLPRCDVGDFIIWDNAPSHQTLTESITTVLSHSGVGILPLPTYSLFESLRACVRSA